MRESAYQTRLRTDMDRWVTDGLLSDTQRDAALATLPKIRTQTAATSLMIIGSVMLGLAVIAFVAANWGGLPRFARVATLAAMFWGSLVAAIALGSDRPGLRNGTLIVSSLVFAAALGLLGQTFNVPGEPWGLFFFAALAGMALGWAGRAPAPVFIGLVFGALAFALQRKDFWEQSLSNSGEPQLFIAMDGLIILFAVVGAFLAAVMHSKWVWHGTILLFGICSAVITFSVVDGLGVVGPLVPALGLAAFWSAVAVLAHLFISKPGMRALLGYSTWFSLVVFVVAFSDITGAALIAHRIVWALLSILAIGNGRSNQQGWVMAAGIVGLLGAASAIMVDLGVDLRVAAIIFLVLAVAALVAAWLLTRKGHPAAKSTPSTSARGN